MVGAEKRAQMSNFRPALCRNGISVRKDWRGEVAGVDASGKKTPPCTGNTGRRPFSPKPVFSSMYSVSCRYVDLSRKLQFAFFLSILNINELCFTAGRLNPTAYQYLDRYLILYNEFKYNILYWPGPEISVRIFFYMYWISMSYALPPPAI